MRPRLVRYYGPDYDNLKHGYVYQVHCLYSHGFMLIDDHHIAWLFSFYKPARYSGFYTTFAPKNWGQRKGARTMTKFTRAELRNILGVACTEGIENRQQAVLSFSVCKIEK